MARYRVGNKYLSEEEYKEETEKDSIGLVFFLSLIVFGIFAYQTNMYLKLHYMKDFSAEVRVALAILPGLASTIIMLVFHKVIFRFIIFALWGLFLFIAWKIIFYFLG